MVGKLMKYELLAIFRTLLYMSVVSLVLACIARIFLAVNADSVAGVLFTFFAIMVAIMLVFVAFVVSVSRFFQSLFKGEGYMTFSLPVSATQLLVAKLLSAIAAMFIGVLVCVLSSLIIFTGFTGELWEEIVLMFNNILNVYGSVLSSDPLLVVELIFNLIVTIPMSLLVFFLIESLGQLFTNHRKGYTFGIGVAFLVVVSLLESFCFDPIFGILADVNVHLANGLQIIVCAAVDVGCFFVTRYLLTKKLNLIV